MTGSALGRWYITAAAALIFAPEVHGHGQLTVPRVRPSNAGAYEDSNQRAPVCSLSNAGACVTGYRCHGFGKGPASDKTALTAGAAFDLTWTMEAGHPGDCYLYVSYDGIDNPSGSDDPSNFIKIASFPGCGAPDGINIPSSVTQSVVLPADLPACDDCVLRWEWTAHQQVSNIEFYVQCADVSIASTAPPTKPSVITAISGVGHLPSQASQYRQVYAGQSPSEQYLVGPAVATFSPCTAGSAGCIGKAVAGGGGGGDDANDGGGGDDANSGGGGGDDANSGGGGANAGVVVGALFATLAGAAAVWYVGCKRGGKRPPIKSFKMHEFRGAPTWDGRAARDTAVMTEWTAHRDPNTGKEYWYNESTGESRWNNPAQAKVKYQPNPPPKRVNIGEPTWDGRTARPKSITVEWAMHTDPDSNLPYWFNAATGESRWDNPTGGKHKFVPKPPSKRPPKRKDVQIKPQLGQVKPQL